MPAHRPCRVVLACPLVLAISCSGPGSDAPADRVAAPPRALETPARPAPGPSPAGAPAARSPADRLSDLVNDARRSNALPELAPDDELGQLARRQAERMARAGRVFHNASLGERMLGGTRWTQFGENVAVGPSIETVHEGLLDSPPHRANILGDFTSIGAGVARSDDGSYYVVEVFGKRALTASAGGK